jgi:hypothetical protein
MRRERQELERLLHDTRSSLDAKISSANETIRMQHAEVHAATGNMRISQASVHEATMQRVQGLGNYEADYSKNMDGVAKVQEDDVTALTANVRQTGSSLEEARVSSKQQLVQALDSGDHVILCAVVSLSIMLSVFDPCAGFTGACL